MLQFDENGYLTPPEIIPTTLADFEKAFATNYPRSVLFQVYLDFVLELKTQGAESFFQWINGSFTTQNPKPNDMDIVTFLPFDLKLMRDNFYLGLKKNFGRKGLDCHFIKTFPPAHPDFVQFEKDKAHWIEIFSTDRDFNPKGIIQFQGVHIF